MTLEKNIEVYLAQRITKRKGMTLKFVSPGHAGVPDRLVILPAGKVIFVEMKRPGEKPRPLQLKVMEKLKNLGCDVRVLDSKEAVNDFVEEVTAK